MTPRSRAPPASNVNKGIPGLLGLPLHVVDCYVNTCRRLQVTMPALIKFPVCIRHHGGNTRGCTSSSIGKVWPYLDFKGKTKEGVRPHFGPLFWQDLWCDFFTTTWLWKKSGVFLTTPCSEKEEGPRCVLVICPLNLIQSDQLRSLAQHDVPACSLSRDCRVNTASGLQHSVEDVKVGKFDFIFAHPEALFNTMEEEALLFDKGFQKLIIAVVVIQSSHG